MDLTATYYPTLKHKTKRKLARLIVGPKEVEEDNSNKVWFVDEQGNPFQDDVDNWKEVYDEFDRPYCRSNDQFEGKFVNEKLKKYLCSREELLKMREEGLLEWEKRVLDKMAGIGCSEVGDVPTKIVFCAFADGSRNCMAERFFLERRGAFSLIRCYNEYTNKFEDLRNTKCFYHTDDQMWMYDGSNLKVIEVNNG